MDEYKMNNSSTVMNLMRGFLSEGARPVIRKVEFYCSSCGKIFMRNFLTDSITGKPILMNPESDIELSLCPECEKLKDEMDKDRSAKFGLAKLISIELQNEAGVPQDISGYSFDGYTPENESEEKGYEAAVSFISPDSVRLLAFIGRVGAGKTRLIVSAGAGLMKLDMTDTNRRKHSILYVTEGKLDGSFRSAFNRNSRITESDIMDTYLAPDLLLIDEIGRTNNTESTYLPQLKQRLVQERLEDRRKKTMLAGNVTVATLVDWLGTAVYSRMNATDKNGKAIGQIMVLNGRDHRYEIGSSEESCF